MIFSRLCQGISRESGGVGGWIVKSRGDLWSLTPEIARGHLDHVVASANRARDTFGREALVVGCLPRKTGSESDYGLRGQARHQPNQTAGIDAARKKETIRNISAQVTLDAI